MKMAFSTATVVFHPAAILSTAFRLDSNKRWNGSGVYYPNDWIWKVAYQKTVLKFSTTPRKEDERTGYCAVLTPKIYWAHALEANEDDGVFLRNVPRWKLPEVNKFLINLTLPDGDANVLDDGTHPESTPSSQCDSLDAIPARRTEARAALDYSDNSFEVCCILGWYWSTLQEVPFSLIKYDVINYASFFPSSATWK